MLTRRQFILGLGASTLLANVGAYARWIEPRWLKVTRHSIPPSDNDAVAREPIRLLHLSDPHLSPVVPLEFIDESLKRGIAERPDLIVITGDYATGRLGDFSDYAQVLSQLPTVAPTFACLGNHDGGPWSRRRKSAEGPDRTIALLRLANIPCLLNQHHTLRVRGRTVQLFGVGDLWNSMCDPATAFRDAPPRNDALRIVLNHNPDAKALFPSYDWDVMLSGHTHGGQIRFPLVGAPFAPVQDKRYLEGLHRWNNRWLHISCGIGNLHGVRFNCRPEISLLTIG